MTTLIFKVIDRIEEQIIRDKIIKTLQTIQDSQVIDVFNHITKNLFRFSEVCTFGSLQLTPDNIKSIKINNIVIDFLQEDKVFFETIKNNIDYLCKFPIILQAGIIHTKDPNIISQLFALYQKYTTLFCDQAFAALTEAKAYLNREYTQASSNGEPILKAVNPYTNDQSTIVVYRPMHGVVHAMRGMLMTEAVIDYFAKYAAVPELKEYCINITLEKRTDIQMIMAFMVTGRESEVGTVDTMLTKDEDGQPLDTKKMIWLYRKNSAKYFMNADSAKHIISDQMKIYKQSILYLCHPDFMKEHLPKILHVYEVAGYDIEKVKSIRQELIALYWITTTAHRLDMRRCRYQEITTHALNASFAEVSEESLDSIKYRDCLIRFANTLIEESGDMLLGKKNRAIVLFCLCSNDQTMCAQVMKKPYNDYRNELACMPQVIAHDENKIDLKDGSFVVYSFANHTLSHFDEKSKLTKKYPNIDVKRNSTCFIMPPDSFFYCNGKSIKCISLEIENRAPLNWPQSILSSSGFQDPFKSDFKNKSDFENFLDVLKGLEDKKIAHDIAMLLVKKGIINDMYQTKNPIGGNRNKKINYLNYRELMSLLCLMFTYNEMEQAINIIGPNYLKRSLGDWGVANLIGSINEIKDEETRFNINMALQNSFELDKDETLTGALSQLQNYSHFNVMGPLFFTDKASEPSPKSSSSSASQSSDSDEPIPNDYGDDDLFGQPDNNEKTTSTYRKK
jgi:hypothetical protein